MKEPIVMYGIELSKFVLSESFNKIYHNSPDAVYLFMQKIETTIKEKSKNVLSIKFSADKKVYVGIEPKYPWENQITSDNVEIAKLIYMVCNEFFEGMDYDTVLNSCDYIKAYAETEI